VTSQTKKLFQCRKPDNFTNRNVIFILIPEGPPAARVWAFLFVHILFHGCCLLLFFSAHTLHRFIAGLLKFKDTPHDILLFSICRKYFANEHFIQTDWYIGNPLSKNMRSTLSPIFCAPYVIISGICPDINIYSGYSSHNGQYCLDYDILHVLQSVVSVNIRICKRNSEKKWEKKPDVITIKPVENSLASNMVTRIIDEVRDKTSKNKILCARKIVEKVKVIICTFTLKHHEFQRKKEKKLTFRMHLIV
jgi:hypothetical protein